ncbi:MAG: helix-turn-helix domain-containing protein [Singulisphaera sp.]|nr:helix-turn-helix domain-containing protein [Singulisphaera sp.]
MPFSALPHELRKSLKGNQTAIVLAATLLEYAKTKAYCYPSNATLAEDMGCCVSTIRNALAALRAAGWVRLELGSNQPNGRRIWLTWRCGPAPPARVPQVSDTPQPIGPPPQPAGPPAQPVGPPPQPAESPVQPVEPKSRIVVVEAKAESSEEGQVADSALRSRPAVPQLPATSEASKAAPRVNPAAATCALPFDLRAIGAVPELHPGPAPPSPSARSQPDQPTRRPRLGLGMTLEELAKVAGDDPILAAELARRTAPPSPPEPPPATVPTAELVTALPGRHDLIMAVARRLCEETGDFKVTSQRTFEKMAESVATRSVPAAVLLSCWRQAMGPTAEHKGKVLVAAWKRSVAEVPPRC